MSAAPSTIMMMLGEEYQFSVETAAYNSIRRSYSWRWEKVDRIGRKPAQQYLGPGAQTVEIEGTILPSYKGGLGQINFMIAEADKRKPLILTDGRGEVWGKFCIKAIDETSTHQMSDGTPLKIEFTMRLEEYGDDKDDKLSHF